MEIKDWLSKLSTRGDVAAAALGYVAGYAVDNYLFPGGLTSGTVAGLSAIGATGIKNLIHAIWNARQDEKRYKGDPTFLEQRADSLRKYISQIIDRSRSPREHRLLPILRELEEQLPAWKSGIIEDDEFNDYLKDVTSSCRREIQSHLAEMRKLDAQAETTAEQRIPIPISELKDKPE